MFGDTATGHTEEADASHHLLSLGIPPDSYDGHVFGDGGAGVTRHHNHGRWEARIGRVRGVKYLCESHGEEGGAKWGRGSNGRMRGDKYLCESHPQGGGGGELGTR